MMVCLAALASTVLAEPSEQDRARAGAPDGQVAPGGIVNVITRNPQPRLPPRPSCARVSGGAGSPSCSSLTWRGSALPPEDFITSPTARISATLTALVAGSPEVPIIKHSFWRVTSAALALSSPGGSVGESGRGVGAGVAAGAGGVHRLPRQIGLKHAMGMILTGRHVTAEEGLRLGFINEVVPHAQVMAAAKRWAAEIMECSPMSVRASKEMSMQGLALGGIEAAANGKYPAMTALFKSSDAMEGPRAFAEKRKPVWKGR